MVIENAALPHGGGNDRELGEEDLALFDITGSLHGYWSDLTRVRLFQCRVADRSTSGFLDNSHPQV